MSLITGTCLFRSLDDQIRDKKLFLVMGQLWVPASIAVKTEHLYKLVGSEYNDASEWPTVGLQILLNSAKDISSDTKKKDPSRIVSLLHTDRP